MGLRTRYEAYRDYIHDDILGEEETVVLKDVGIYFKQFPVYNEIDWDTFQTWFLTVQHPTLKQDKVKIYKKFLSLLKKTKIDTTLVESMLASFLARSFGTKVYKEAQEVAEGNVQDMEGVHKIMEDYRGQMAKSKTLEDCRPDWEIGGIVSSTIGSGGLNWKMKILNQSLGPLRKADFIIVGKRPDSGGTTFLAQEAGFMAQQMKDDECVLWFNNEEAGAKVQLRILQAQLNQTSEDINVNPKAAMDEYTKLMNGEKNRIIVYDKAILEVKDITLACKKHNVKLIIFDQLWKVQGIPEASNDVHKMTLLFNLGREWAKEFAPVITVHQCDGQAGGMEYIPMENLYMSKTGVQGEADAIITLGRSYDPAKKHSRFINVPKNKLAGGPDSVPAMRNMQREVLLDAERAQFTGGVL
jgi:Autographiviridae putative DNA helicase